MRHELIICDLCGRETRKAEQLTLPIGVHGDEVIKKEMDVCRTCAEEIAKKTIEVMSNHNMTII